MKLDPTPEVLVRPCWEACCAGELCPWARVFDHSPECRHPRSKYRRADAEECPLLASGGRETVVLEGT